MTCFLSLRGSVATKQSPGRVSFRKAYTSLFGRGIFRCAQYDVLFLHVILNDSEESHRRTDKHILYHFGRGIFRCAQYDVKSPIVALPPLRLRGGRAPFVAIAPPPPFHRGSLPRRRKQNLSLRGSEATKQTPGRVSFRKAYTSLWSWDISLHSI